MPIIKNIEEREITLPESGAKVKFLERMTYGVILDWGKTEADKTDDLALAAFLITGWDLTDEAGQPLPINKDSFRKLSFADGDFLITEINKSFTKGVEEKKTLASE
ncbi:MAG: hypothetical protein WC737_05745 [Parcubacteria group bacterium]|jgi:hypothetical protein